MQELFTDYVFTCPTRLAVKSVINKKRLWVYTFDQPSLGHVLDENYIKYCKDHSCKYYEVLAISVYNITYTLIGKSKFHWDWGIQGMFLSPI